MSGTRFARSGRCRFFICLGVLVLMFGMIAIFHSSQQQLDESREKRLICEQQQEALNERLQSVVELKFSLEKSQDHERTEQMETRRILEQKLKDLKDSHTKEQMDTGVRFEKLQHSHTLLQSEHNELVNECAKSKKQHLEDTNIMEKKLQSARSKIQKEKIVQDGEITFWKEKYESILHEKERLEIILNTADSKGVLFARNKELEQLVADYKSNCQYKPLSNGPQQLSSPLSASTARHVVNSGNMKSFKEQVLVSPGLYQIVLNTTNKTQDNVSTEAKYSTTNNLSNFYQQAVGGGGEVVGVGDGAASAKSFKSETIQAPLPFSARNNHSLIINSVENFQILPKPIKKPSEETETQLKHQPIDGSFPAPSVNGKIISPLSAPQKPTSTLASKSARLRPVLNSSIASSSSNLPPLPMPPNQRKLPENVAPIPANFDELLKNELSLPKSGDTKLDVVNGGDVDAAVEDMQKNNEDGNNNRYANVVQGLDNKGRKVVNEDSGAHEIKDHEFANDHNMNLPPEEESNFFDGGKNAIGGILKRKEDDNEDQELVAGGPGDIAVKNHNHLIDNLNNEVAGDQGKEFPDGLRLEEANEEDEDEDDYSNLAARQQGAQAIRN